MKYIFTLLVLVLGTSLTTLASHDSEPKNDNIEVTIAPIVTDVVFTMNDITTTTPVADVNLVQGAVEVMVKMDVNKVAMVEHKWEPVPDGYGGVQIYEEYAYMPAFGGGGQGSWIKTGTCKSSAGTVYNCSTGGGVW